MSSSSWTEWKKKTREKPGNRGKNARIAILGIGNEFNGDDAVGVITARDLQQKLTKAFRKEGREYEMKGSSLYSASILVIDAGLAPENFSGGLRAFQPRYLLLIDAADINEPAGHFEVINWQAAGGYGASTHLQPLATFGAYLVSELGCEIDLLGIQPAQNQFDRPLTGVVKAAVSALVDDLYHLLVKRD
jgi:hydrogenase 3 maturation protease